MSYDIQNRLSLKVLFNDEEFIFNRANELEFLHMVQSTKISVPMLHLVLQDNLDSLSTSAQLSDGTRIQIVVAYQTGKSATYAFRLNSVKRSPQGGGYRYEIDGYLDTPTFWHTSRTDGFTGTSYEALKHISSRCGLNFAGSPTSDAQLWIPRNMRYHEWAKDIASAGFRSDSGFMKMALNLDKTLVYRDLTEQVPAVKNLIFGDYRQDAVMVFDAVPQTSSGTLNHYAGYQDMLVEQDVQSSGKAKENKNVTVAKGIGQKSLMVNSKVKQAVDQSRIIINPIDPGNTHANYERAVYQNERMNALFSSKVDVVTAEDTRLQVLDYVNLVIDKGSDYLKSFSGGYHVVTRAIRVQGNDYYEKLELSRRSANVELKDAL